MIVSWNKVLSEPLLTVLISALPPKPAPRLAPLACNKIKITINMADPTVM